VGPDTPIVFAPPGAAEQGAAVEEPDDQARTLDDVFEGPNVKDLGCGVKVVFTTWREHDPGGMIEEHDRPDGKGRCRGSILFDVPGAADAFPGVPRWTLESVDPLTLSPSLLCTMCGHHGFVRSGCWEPC
jgi:hypothetical protein